MPKKVAAAALAEAEPKAGVNTTRMFTSPVVVGTPTNEYSGLVLRTVTVAPLVPARPLTILKLVPGVNTPVTVGTTVMPVALIFEAPDGTILPNTVLPASVVAIVPPTLVVKAPVMVKVFAPKLNPCACTAPVIAALPPTTLICRSPLAPPIAPITALPLLRVSVPVFAVLVVIAPISVRFAPRLRNPSPTKFGAEVTFPLKFTVPVPLMLEVVAKTSPLKFTVAPAAPALMFRKLIKAVPVNPVTVELP